ncbi:MAG: dual specificity protein phosphatase family protein [Nitrososphaerota archaeon]|nr:dual specificity protein phosphatase family protein [Nitrososphaerota archaeon]
MGIGGKLLRRLRAKVEDRPTGFVWVEDQSLAGTGYPASRSQVEWLVKNGIGSILSLTEEPLPHPWVEGLALVVEHVPMKDHEAPTVDSMDRGARFIEGELKAGRTVAVHCLAGEGRTGCVLSAYLIRTEGLTADQAMAKLRSLKPGFVEPKQEAVVYDFATKQGSVRGAPNPMP